MNTLSRSIPSTWLALSLALFTCVATWAGTFKHITIDGSFADWAGVPVAVTDDEGDMVEGTLKGFDLREVYVANDEQYLYLRVVIYPSSTNPDYSKYHHHFFFDTDNDPGTGRGWLGLGSEMMIEDAGGYSERYGTFNDGQVTGLDWAQAPSSMLPTYQYEARVSRVVRDTQPADVPVGSGNPERDLPVFSQDEISIGFEVQDSNWAIEDQGSAFPYVMAPAPAAFSGTQALVGLTTSTWRLNDTGIDPGAAWLTMGYDDTQAGWKQGAGLLGYNAPSGVYPAPVNTTLANGRTAYYLRSHFTWNSDQTGAGLLVSNYLSAGAVFYLNGAEMHRVRMPEGPVTADTPATGTASQPGVVELFDLPASGLVVGDNLLEVEVHQASGVGSSLVFGASLTASDNFAPRIQDPTQPVDRNVVEGDSTTLSAGALAGTPPFTYQWSKNGTPINGATGATLVLNSVTDADAGKYSVEIANPKGLKVTSRAAAVTTTAVPIVLSNPNLPTDQTVAEGLPVTFTVDASGSLPVYQWYRENEAILGEVGPQLTLDSVPLSENGTRYSVVVSNRISSVTSRQAKLTVVSDSNPPFIASVAGGGKSIVVTFSEPVDRTSADKASSYRVDGGLQIQSATLDPVDGRVATLVTTLQTFGQAYKVLIPGVQDRFGNAGGASAMFRSTIFLDASFEDWSSIPVALSQEQTNPGTVEYKDLSITNDNEYLYLRFSYYTPVGPLGPANWSDRGHHYDIVIDADQDPATGTWDGGDVLIEDGSMYRLAGGWTQGAFDGADVVVSPGETLATDFELRISRKAVHQTDGLPAFPNPSINIFCVTQSTGWAALDRTTPTVPYTFVTFPALPVTPGPIVAKRLGTKLELTWVGSGVLETRPSLTTGGWTTVAGAVSGIQIDLTSAPAGYYRLRQ